MNNISRSVKCVLYAILVVFVAGCTKVIFVQPYDADLYSNTEEFYKKASGVVAAGMAVSPLKSKQRSDIIVSKALLHPAHYNQFKTRYDSLRIDANALILRALTNSGRIDPEAEVIHNKIETVIAEAFPTECDDLQGEFPDVSLTVRNYIDLKCLIGKWDRQHSSKETIGERLILKKANWEARSRTLFQAVLTIQKSEASKKDD